MNKSMLCGSIIGLALMGCSPTISPRQLQRAAECNSKEGTYLLHEDLCLDLAHFRLGEDTSHIFVTVYGADYCEFCHNAAQYLQRRHIRFVEKDAMQEDVHLEMDKILDFAKIEHGLIPVIVVYDTRKAATTATVIRGFDQIELRNAIEARSDYKE